MARNEKRKVVAVFPDGKFGFINNQRIYDGDELTVSKNEFSEVWMRLAEGERKFSSETAPALKLP